MLGRNRAIETDLEHAKSGLGELRRPLGIEYPAVGSQRRADTAAAESCHSVHAVGAEENLAAPQADNEYPNFDELPCNVGVLLPPELHRVPCGPSVAVAAVEV